VTRSLSNQEEAAKRAAAPVHLAADEPADKPDEQGIGLCLSGGGFRAMLFHVGALRRLNELRYLRRINRFSSVSGGSITAGVLAARWNELDFDDKMFARNFDDLVLDPLRDFAGRTIDMRAIVVGLLTPGSINDKVVRVYRRLLGSITLEDLPDSPPGPSFVFNATNLQSGVLWQFSKPSMSDYLVGAVARPKLPLAVAVGASSAFPPLLSPAVLKLKAAEYVPGSGHGPPEFRHSTRVVLTDGGVYDNLGLEPVWKHYRTVLVSDAGGTLALEGRPARFWPLQLNRVFRVINAQVRSLRKRQTIAGFAAGIRDGTYWGIRTNILDYRLEPVLPCPEDRTGKLASIPTRLTKIDDVKQQQLINWGYAVCDAAMRRHVETTAPAATGFPFPAAGVG
jgi:NTE family protein